MIAPVLIQCLVLVAGATEAPGAEAKPSVADAVFEHVTDGRVIEFQVPLMDKRLEWRTPEWGLDLGGHHIDLSITKHLFWMWVASFLLVLAAVLARNARGKALVPKGGANLIEMVVLFIRDEIAVKNMGSTSPSATRLTCARSSSSSSSAPCWGSSRTPPPRSATWASLRPWLD